MRGKGSMTTPLPPCFRITPAYAGKSAPLRQCQGSSRDHPRLCGEKFMSTVVIVPSGGSPPPMRGKVQRKVRHDTPTRITPAYAGKRFHLWVVHSQQRDHPRLCGEKAVVFSDAYDNLGSPPPMRGKACPKYR